MKRRDFLKILSPVVMGSMTGCSHIIRICEHCMPHRGEPQDAFLDRGEVSSGEAHQAQPAPEDLIHDQRARSDFFDRDFPSDIWANKEEFQLLSRLAQKFDAIQRYVGHGNFNILGYNEAVRFAKLVSGLDEFTTQEKKRLEELFYFNAELYGFMGEKIFHELDSGIKRRDVVKVPYTGHFLLKGSSLDTYERLSRDVGEGLILTSGVRSLAKQFHLFLEKVRDTNGNISRASRSLAPPGYSFHGRGDFDVGKVGKGLLNFTDRFAETEEFKRLIELGYIDIRYEQSNTLGVRFEPWHIKVES
jgi:zinc D-Ala-D-Ala carboxypeptidase